MGVASDHFDFIIIGSGFGGSVSALRLTEKGYRVLVLEKGRRFGKEVGREEHFHMADVAVYFGEPGKTVKDPYFGGEGPERAGCIFCGACMTGCRHGAKNTLDLNYLFLAEKHGARLLPETEVTAV